MATRDELVGVLRERYGSADRAERGRILDEFVVCYEGFEAATVLARLYRVTRLYVNHFQPSFKLAGKEREGARVRKRYHAPATPFARLLADPRTPAVVVRTMDALHATLDPIALLRNMRALQAELAGLADRPAIEENAPTAPALDQFLAGLRTAWKDGEVRPTARAKPVAKRERRRPDPFAAVTDTLRDWFEAEPWRSSGELLERLRTAHPGLFQPGQLRTLQRRVKGWRSEAAHKLVFGTSVAAPASIAAVVAE